ncbi:hypothetical protein C1645_832641 [Glomus cerebriforme]|uniref:Uncharacterized protein n=1 Tax=Glomus cerebriforme TaxID=658196 RepID=A0A397SJ69_9GLOM|nr:hypothetical protein C1645_832641 [Glomus cerebriforme]
MFKQIDNIEDPMVMDAFIFDDFDALYRRYAIFWFYVPNILQMAFIMLRYPINFYFVRICVFILISSSTRSVSYFTHKLPGYYIATSTSMTQYRLSKITSGLCSKKNKIEKRTLKIYIDEAGNFDNKVITFQIGEKFCDVNYCATNSRVAYYIESIENKDENLNLIILIDKIQSCEHSLKEVFELQSGILVQTPRLLGGITLTMTTFIE